MLTDKTLEEIERIKKKYPNTKSACMEALQAAQREKGHVTECDMRAVAEALDIEPIEVQEVGGFYTMYNVEKPKGRHHVQVCRNLSCSLLGAEHIILAIEQELGIKTGETTEDNRITLSTAECLGSCGTAPMMQINDEFHEDLTVDKVSDILKGLK